MPYMNFTHPANQSVLAFLHVEDSGTATLQTPSEIDYYSLGTHPDLVEYLWKMGREINPNCSCVINQRSSPILVHPITGIIFAMAGGTSTLAMRLPEPERSAMLAVPGYGASYQYPSTTIYAKDIGEDWVLIRPFDAHNPQLCRRAYEYAGIEAPPIFRDRPHPSLPLLCTLMTPQGAESMTQNDPTDWLSNLAKKHNNTLEAETARQTVNSLIARIDGGSGDSNTVEPWNVGKPAEHNESSIALMVLLTIMLLLMGVVALLLLTGLQ